MNSIFFHAELPFDWLITFIKVSSVLDFPSQIHHLRQRLTNHPPTIANHKTNTKSPSSDYTVRCISAPLETPSVLPVSQQRCYLPLFGSLTWQITLKLCAQIPDLLDSSPLSLHRGRATICQSCSCALADSFVTYFLPDFPCLPKAR